MTVFVHGGVSGTPKPRVPLGEAVAAGTSRSQVLDAIEAAVCVMEDNAVLNAGYGSVLGREGTLEMDAGIAHGPSGSCGGVANVRVRHPIALARRVLEKTPHVLITGVGAATLGADLEHLEQTSPDQVERWEQARAEGLLDLDRFGAPELVDTVGAVALINGELAAGSSTGGVLGKLTGRVGDAPLFGAGIYASPNAAVVGTGVGEFFIETVAAFRAGLLIEQGETPQRACEEVIELLGTRRRVSAGLLALDGEGRVGAAYRGASWSVEGPGGPVEARRLD